MDIFYTEAYSEKQMNEIIDNINKHPKLKVLSVTKQNDMWIIHYVRFDN